MLLGGREHSDESPQMEVPSCCVISLKLVDLVVYQCAIVHYQGKYRKLLSFDWLWHVSLDQRIADIRKVKNDQKPIQTTQQLQNTHSHSLKIVQQTLLKAQDGSANADAKLLEALKTNRIWAFRQEKMKQLGDRKHLLSKALRKKR